MLAENLGILPRGPQDVTYTHVTHGAWALCSGASANSEEVDSKMFILVQKMSEGHA